MTWPTKYYVASWVSEQTVTIDDRVFVAEDGILFHHFSPLWAGILTRVFVFETNSQFTPLHSDKEDEQVGEKGQGEAKTQSLMFVIDNVMLLKWDILRI